MKHTNTRRLRGTMAAIVLLCALPLGLAACSSDAGPGPDAPRADAGIGAKWGACMRDAGFDVQDPDDALVASGAMSSPQGVDQSAFTEAGTACAERIGVQRDDTAEQQKWARQYAAVASCVREQYSDFPEQEPGGFSVDDDYAPAQDPAFQQTVDACMTKYSPDTHQQHVG